MNHRDTESTEVARHSSQMRHLAIALTLLLSAAAYGRGRPTRLPEEWRTPACDPWRVGASFWYVIDNRAAGLVQSNAALDRAPRDLVVSDVANLVFAIFDGSIYQSIDAGCDWRLRGAIAGEQPRLIAAQGGGAYAWSGRTLIKITRLREQTFSLPDDIIALGAHSEQPDRLIAVTPGGALHTSFDGGATWVVRGAIAGETLRAAAVDPFDFDHVFAASDDELWESRDGGVTWTRRVAPAPLTDIAFSPVERGVVWLRSDSSIYRSLDGGASSSQVLRSGPMIPVRKSTRLAPHPSEATTVAFITDTGLGILDLVSNTTRVAVVEPPQSIVWSPTGRLLYATIPQISVPLY